MIISDGRGFDFYSGIRSSRVTDSFIILNILKECKKELLTGTDNKA